jgi:hypothetical protein
VADGGLRQDEIDCEQAVSYLQGCCPNLDPSNVVCVHDRGCSTHIDPELTIAESQCILATSCHDAIATGICERLRALPQPMDNDAGVEVNTPHPPVCP